MSHNTNLNQTGRLTRESFELCKKVQADKNATTSYDGFVPRFHGTRFLNYAEMSQAEKGSQSVLTQSLLARVITPILF
jgi:hypothetical protein